MPDVLILSRLHPTSMRRLDEGFDTHHGYAGADAQTLVADVGERIRGIATSGEVPLGGEVMDRLPGLEIISSFGVGYDAIDVDAARERGVVVTNTPDVLTDDVADLAVGLMVAVARRLVAADRYVRDGSWARHGAMPLAARCSGRVAGILGLGRIGAAIARRCRAMEMEVAYHNRRPRDDVDHRYCDSPRALAAAADFLIVACPGGPVTRHLVDAGVLAALGADGYLVNIARGSVVDEPALVEALDRGVIKGAALDVFEHEPHVPEALLARDDVVLAPHVGSATVETREAMANLTVDNLVAHFAGRGALTPVT